MAEVAAPVDGSDAVMEDELLTTKCSIPKTCDVATQYDPPTPSVKAASFNVSHQVTIPRISMLSGLRRIYL